jgi:hypothetical protein
MNFPPRIESNQRVDKISCCDPHFHPHFAGCSTGLARGELPDCWT